MAGIVVVARWNENLDWTRDLPPGWTVRVVQKDHDLPNEGREASSYLWFLETQPIDPNAIYAFVQGDPFPHGFHPRQLREDVAGYAPLGTHLLNEAHDGAPNHPGLDLIRGMWEWLGLREQPDRFVTAAGAQFLVPGRVLASRPASWYGWLRERVTALPAGPWVMERLWPNVWPRDPGPHPSGWRPHDGWPGPAEVAVAPAPAYPVAAGVLAAGQDPQVLRERLCGGVDPYAGAPVLAWDRQGWNGDLPVFGRLVQEVRPALAVEVGTWKGLSAITMGQALRHHGGHLICVDTWLGSYEFMDCRDRQRLLARVNGYPSVYATFVSNVVHAALQDTITPCPQTSRNAARWFRHHNARPGLIYLDGGHEYEDVAEDLALYWPLLAPGGVLFGDDYDAKNWPGVVEAVNDHTSLLGLTLEREGVHWILRKPRA